MAIRDNAVFSTSLLFSSQFSQIFPEAVLYGYSNVVLMEENQIKHLLPDTNENMDDLESVYGWFQEQGLNPNLIKSGMPYLMEVLSLEENVTENFHAFTEYLANAPKYVPSVDILNMALKLAVLPMMEIFGKDCTMQNVFEYHSLALESVLGELDQEDGETEEFPMDYEGDYGEESMMIPESHDILDTALISPRRMEHVKEKRTLAQLSKMYRTVGSALFETVKGQDKVILKFLEYLNRCELYKSIDDRKSVAGSFFFSGPHGSGKSLVARTIAEVLEEKYNIPYQYYNCKQFATSESVKNLLNEPSGNATETQDSLLEFVRKNPKCTLIFENVERGDMTVIALLGAIINTGVIFDESTNSVISFEDATILFTSDFGEEFFEDRRADYSEVPKETFVQKVIYEQVDDPEMSDEIKMYYSLMLRLIDRSYVLLLNYLSIRLMLEMITSYIDYFVLQMKTEFNINIAYSPYLPQILLYRFGGSLDASNALTKTSDFLMDEIYGFLKQSSASVKKISHMNIDVEYDPKNYEIARMFEYSDHYEILFFTSKEEALTDKFKKNDHYRITRVSDYASATAMLRNGVDVVFIDPFYGLSETDKSVLSVTDYDTDGVKLFHHIVEKKLNIPVFILEMNTKLTDVDRNTFIKEGATNTIYVNSKRVTSFQRVFHQTIEEVYLSREIDEFVSRGLYLDCNSKQELNEEGDVASIVFYDFKKKLDVDAKDQEAIVSVSERPKTRFEDVIGATKAKEELSYFVEYLKNPKKFLMNGGQPPHGILLYGPPGTGKTMLAKAMAGESNATFLATSATSFMDSLFGGSEDNIRMMFAKAKKYAPSIIFIDEIDAIGKRRTGSISTNYTETMLNTILTEMDGFASQDLTKPVFVLAATNYAVDDDQPGIAPLDEALVRRFDNKIMVPIPVEAERKEYIKRFIEKKGKAEVSEETMNSLAERTTGQSLAILEHVMDAAYRTAVRAERLVKDQDLLDALEDYVFGEKKESTPEYYRTVAIHETGHAYISYLAGVKPAYITIESRSDFGGYMLPANEEEVNSYTKDDILGKIRCCLAGRAAETVFFGKEKSINTGASNDLHQATEWAFRLVCNFGMLEGQLIYLDKDQILASPLAASYVEKVNTILTLQMQETLRLIEKGKDTIARIAGVLTKENRLTGAQFEELMKEAGEMGDNGKGLDS